MIDDLEIPEFLRRKPGTGPRPPKPPKFKPAYAKGANLYDCHLRDDEITNVPQGVRTVEFLATGRKWVMVRYAGVRHKVRREVWEKMKKTKIEG